MRDIGEEYKTGFRAPWEVNDLLGLMETRAAKDKTKAVWQVHKEDGERKKPTRAALISALVLAVSKMGEKEQDALLARGMDALNRLILERTDIQAANGAPDQTGGKVAPPPTTGTRKKAAQG